MKPILLSMTAFGPYKKTEVIDFRELKDNRLFVISGNTGAGKTTIFDAICFALYGEASGEDRKDPTLLRSHYAEDEDHTAVDLSFQLKSKVYRVFRQIPHVKEGNKTATGGRQELYQQFEDGREVPIVDRMIVTEVNKKLEALLGLSKDQFSQIVMLPQGEFRKLLTSETENKEAILRRIFKTEPYQWMVDRLKEKRSEAKGVHDQEHLILNGQFGSIQNELPERETSPIHEVFKRDHYNSQQVLEALELEAEDYKALMASQNQAFHEAERLYNEALERLHILETLNHQFVKLAERKKRKAELEMKRSHFEAQEIKRGLAERATHIRAYESHYLETEKDVREKKVLYQKACRVLEDFNQKLQAAILSYEEAKNEEALRVALSNEWNRLDQLAPKVEQLDQKKQALKRLKQEVEDGRKRLEQFNQDLEKEEQALSILNERIREWEQQVEGLSREESVLVQLRDQVKVLKSAVNQHQRVHQLTGELKQKEADQQSSQKKLTDLEKVWINGQASLLAEHLHNGEACPVCGSSEHPNPAVLNASIPSRKALEEVRQFAQEKARLFHTVTAQLESATEQWQQLQSELIEVGLQTDHLEGQHTAIIEKGMRQKGIVERLRKLSEELKQQKTNYDQRTIQFKKQNEQLLSLQTEQNDKQTTYAKEEAVYQEVLNGIPEILRNLGAFQKRQEEVTKELTTLEKKWQSAQEMMQTLQSETTTQKTRVEASKTQLDELEQKAQRDLEVFTNEWKRAGFESVEHYRSSILSEDALAELKQSITSFFDEFNRVTQQVEDLEQELKDKEQVDLVALEARCVNLKEGRDQAQQKRDQSRLLLEKIGQFQASLHACEVRMAKAEQALATVDHLYSTLRGNNGKRLSLERYLQIEFLERILQHANGRLQKLSNGQFYLIRSERVEKNSRPSGLGLDVYDSYTGQTRDVKSLSGGEKFNASLSLALGMSDVIQAYQGGVSIETMFIDEGFGSLDEESLNKAIDALIDLQRSGRMIGIISHVQELKTQIPALLEVTKAKEGHSQTTFRVSV